MRKVNVPTDVSLLIASDGTASAPAADLDHLAARQLDPLVEPAHHRRHRRPAHRPDRLALGPHPRAPPPRTAPQDPQDAEAPEARPVEAGAQARRDHRGATEVSRGRRRAFVALPLLLVGALALSACTADGGALPSASPSATDAAVAEVEPPVVTERQFTPDHLPDRRIGDRRGCGARRDPRGHPSRRPGARAAHRQLHRPRRRRRGRARRRVPHRGGRSSSCRSDATSGRAPCSRSSRHPRPTSSPCRCSCRSRRAPSTRCTT